MQWKSVDFIEDLFQTLGVGEERKVELQEIDKMIYIPEDPPAPGKFVSVFPAFLVGLLEAVLARFFFFLKKKNFKSKISN